MNWNIITTNEELAEIRAKSFTTPQLIFKHSTRCGVSQVVKTRLEAGSPPPAVDFHFLDLIRYRSLSNKIAEDLDVRHESPQVLLVKDGRCIFDESHLSIRMQDIVKEVA